MRQCIGLVLVQVVLLLKLYSSQGKVSKLYFSQFIIVFVQEYCGLSIAL